MLLSMVLRSSDSRLMLMENQVHPVAMGMMRLATDGDAVGKRAGGNEDEVCSGCTAVPAVIAAATTTSPWIRRTTIAAEGVPFAGAAVDRC